MTKKKSRQELLDEVNKNELLKKAVSSDEAAMNFKKALRDPLDFKKQLRLAKEQEKQASYAKKEALSQTYWDEMLKAAHELLHSGQQGYDSWVSAMSSVVQSAERRNKALWSSIDLLIITNWLPSLALSEDKLPGVRYSVEFDADNKMVIKDLVRVNSKPLDLLDAIRTKAHGNSELEFNRTQILAFQAMVVAFLAEKHGCEPDKNNPGQFLNKQGRTVTQHELNGYLNSSVGQDLKSYLKLKLEAKTPGPGLDDSIDIEPLSSSPKP